MSTPTSARDSADKSLIVLLGLVPADSTSMAWPARLAIRPAAVWDDVAWLNLSMFEDSQNLLRGADSRADEQSVELAVEVFTMLADATRVRIVLALQDGELSVNTLAELVGKSPTAVSQHLAKLRLARIVATRHEANRVYYRLANEHARRLVADAIFQAEHSVDDHPGHHRRVANGDH